MLNGATRLHLIVGDPVAQTKSPAGLTEEFAARGADAICVAVQAARADFDDVMRALRRVCNVDGLIITVPHKASALAHCERPSQRARALGALNVMRRDGDGAWSGDMTDGHGLLAALFGAGVRVEGGRALVVGAGGAGSAIALALLQAGVGDLAIADIDAARRDRLIARLAAAGAGRARPATGDPSSCGLVVNATPAGMSPDDAMPVDASRLAASAVVADLVTSPVMTPLLQAAARRGCRIVTGTDVFAAQRAALADFLLATVLAA